MKEIYFITATNTDVGKSYASERFLQQFSQQNKKVGYFKPIETGVNSTPIDGSHLLQITQKFNPNFKATIDDVVPYQFKLPAAPFVAKENSIIDINRILEKIKYLHTMCDVLIIEGAGGLMVPIEKDFFMIDLIQKINPTMTYLITPSKLGSINDTLLSIEALKNRNINFEWFINLYKDQDSFETITLPFYKAYFDSIRFL